MPMEEHRVDTHAASKHQAVSQSVASSGSHKRLEIVVVHVESLIYHQRSALRARSIDRSCFVDRLNIDRGFGASSVSTLQLSTVLAPLLPPCLLRPSVAATAAFDRQGINRR